MGNPQAQRDGPGKPKAGDQDGKRQGGQRKQEEHPPSVAEWAAAALGLALVLGSLGVLGWEVLDKDDGPPAISFEVQGIEPSSGGFVVTFAVFNSGPQTAAGLHVSGTLKAGGKEVERSEVELDYVPSQSSRRSGFFFTRDPRRLQLELRAEGYRPP